MLTSILHPVYAQAPALPDKDNTTYPGLYWGVAGIVSSILDMAKFLPTDIQQSMNNSIAKAMNYVWESRLTLDNGTRVPTWEKVRGYYAVFPGQKYGAAGIIRAFVKYYHYSQNSTFLNYASQAASELMLEARNASTIPNWSYEYEYPPSYEDISITDVKYGNLGIMESFLELYQATHDQQLARWISKMYDWLDYTSRNRTIGNSVYKVLPWYNIEGASSDFFTSYSEGNAGAVDVFLQLYDEFQNQSYFDWANEITRALIESQLSTGGWPYFIDNTGVVNRISWQDGSIGILHSLLTAQNHGLGTTELNATINKGFEWLSTLFRESGSKFYLPEYVEDTSGFTSHSRGITGAAQIYREYASNQYSDLYNQIIDNLVTSTLTQKSVNGTKVTLANAVSSGSEYFDLSLSDGLAGIASELTHVLTSNSSPSHTDTIQQILERICQTYLYIQRKDGSWPRQIILSSNSKTPFPSSLIIGISLAMLVFIRSKKRIR